MTDTEAQALAQDTAATIKGLIGKDLMLTGFNLLINSNLSKLEIIAHLDALRALAEQARPDDNALVFDDSNIH